MNLIIITSILNPINKPLDYCNKRTIYSIEERYQQTIITINSIKEKIPNYFMVPPSAWPKCSGRAHKWSGRGVA